MRRALLLFGFPWLPLVSLAPQAPPARLTWAAIHNLGSCPVVYEAPPYGYVYFRITIGTCTSHVCNNAERFSLLSVYNEKELK